jgi:hypothetical protein
MKKEVIFFLGLLICLGTTIWYASKVTSLTIPIKFVKARDYQVEILNDTMYIYDNQRFVGEVKMQSDLDSMIIQDNE